MDEKKERKLSEKLYKDILKHGDKNIDKFLSKGANAEMVLDDWSYDDTNIDSNILFYLFDKISPENIDTDSKYFYKVVSLYVTEKGIEEIIELSRKINSPKMLEVLTTRYFEEVAYNGNMNLVSKYYEAIKVCLNDNVSANIDMLSDIVAACSTIPYGDKHSPEKNELMEKSYNLCKMLCDKGVDAGAGRSKVGVLSKIYSPIVEEDEASIEFIFNVCKLLMDAGADLHGDKDSRSNEKTIDSICRKDFSNKLREKLESYYSQHFDFDEDEKELF